MRVEKRHHREFIRSLGIRFARARSALIAKGQRRLVAVMTIGNDQLLRGHRAGDPANRSGVGDRPQLMDHAVLVLQLDSRRSAADHFEHRVNLL